MTTSSSSAPWDDLAAAVRSGAVVLDTPDPSSLLEVGGADRVRFLNGYMTCQVEGLAVGTGTYGFVTTVKGRVQSDLVVLALEDSLLLRVPTDRREAVAQHLGKYILADRVTIEDRTSRSVTLLGAAGWEIAPRAVASLPEQPPEAPWSHVDHTDESGLRTVVVREPSLAIPSAPSDTGLDEVPRWSLWWLGEAEAVDQAAEAWRSDLGDIPEASTEFETTLRVLAGRARHGVDFDDDHFPHETGLEAEGVSYTKGCYLGQEVVARIHYRGGVNRSLRGLVLEGGAAEDLAGRSLSLDGREAGRWTSVAQLTDGRTLGLAILHHRVEPGSIVAVDGAAAVESTETPATARVVELPWSGEDLGL